MYTFFKLAVTHPSLPPQNVNFLKSIFDFFVNLSKKKFELNVNFGVNPPTLFAL